MGFMPRYRRRTKDRGANPLLQADALNRNGGASRYLIALNLNFWPPREASYMSPPFATVKTAMPL